MDFYLIPNDLRQALMNYLATKPYAEVVPFINALTQLQKSEPNDGTR